MYWLVMLFSYSPVPQLGWRSGAETLLLEMAKVPGKDEICFTV